MHRKTRERTLTEGKEEADPTLAGVRGPNATETKSGREERAKEAHAPQSERGAQIHERQENS